jgi:hypothetical protein
MSFKLRLYQKRETSHSDLPIGCGAQLALQAAQKLLDENLLLVSIKACLQSFERQKMAPSAFLG